MWSRHDAIKYYLFLGMSDRLTLTEFKRTWVLCLRPSVKRNGGMTRVGAVTPRQVAEHKRVIKLNCLHFTPLYYVASDRKSRKMWRTEPCDPPVYIRANDTADRHNDSGRENRDAETVMSQPQAEDLSSEYFLVWCRA